MITEKVKQEIESTLGEKIVSITPLSAANNAHIYRLKTSKNRRVVVKIAERGLDIEAFMLNYLTQKTQLPVPAVIYSNAHIILMEYVEAHHSLDIKGQIHAAELLSDLHKIKGDAFGFERDTLIASLHQPNEQAKDWVSFFTEHRLLYMANQALDEGKIDAKMRKQFDKLAAKLPAYLQGHSQPCLIHGDIWSGNVLAGRDKVAAFLDPAIYYADPEIELAFISLFDTFGEQFFRHYNEISPIRFGFFEERRHIYNLYPLLVHTRLFGSSYARKAQKILDKFA